MPKALQGSLFSPEERVKLEAEQRELNDRVAWVARREEIDTKLT